MDVPQHVLDAQAGRMRFKDDHRGSIDAIYPHARTFVLVHADSIEGPSDTTVVPETLTMVTPNLDDPGMDHLYVGTRPVVKRNLRWKPAFEELSFDAEGLSGHLRLTHSRTRAFGVLSIDGSDVSVQYRIAPQRYLVRMAAGAAYVATGSGKPVITWNTTDSRWRDAAWPEGAQLGFTFGPESLGTFSESSSIGLTVKFDDVASRTAWVPSPAVSSCTIDSKRVLRFDMLGGAKPPKSSETSDLFPYQFHIQLSPFGESFDGGALAVRNDVGGTAYGVIGEWDGGHVAGAYRLRVDGRDVIVGVHHGELYLGDRKVGGGVTGSRLSWTGATGHEGLPADGQLDFSADGATVIGSSFGATGARVAPDEFHSYAAPAKDPYNLTDLNRMTQFATDANNLYFDEIQQQSMGDFYQVLLHDMNQDLRRKFLVRDADMKPLARAVRDIGDLSGDKGTKAKGWYESLGLAYTAQTLAKWSDDPAAQTLNGTRAGAWLTRQTETSDVMAVQSPRFYQNRYVTKYQAQLDWFLLDQENPDKKADYDGYIDGEVKRWIAEIDRDYVGTPQEITGAKKRVTDLGDTAKEKQLYWAFRLYVQASSPAYLNLLQSILEDPTNDGSSFTQQVQRTVALMDVLDPSNVIAQEYAYLLQLFELGSLLPQLIDYGNDVAGFNFAVKQIIDAFVKKYLDSPDPQLREAALQLQKDADVKTIGQMLEMLRTAAAVNAGLYSWALIAERYETAVKRAFGSLPAWVAKGVMMAAVGLLISFCVQGQVTWDDIPAADKSILIGFGVGIVVQGFVYLVKRGIATGELMIPGQRWGQTLKLYFTPGILTEFQKTNAAGFRGWLINTTVNEMRWRSLWVARQTAAGAARSAINRTLTLGFVFGRNMREFIATRVGAALAIGGIVMSAIALHNSDTPEDKAINSLFLIASALEFIAVAGAWGLAFAGVTAIGGLAVGTILTAISIVGLVVLIAGVILLLVMMNRPQPSPIEQFAKDAGQFYMPYKAAIDSFDVYQPLSQPQRAGVAIEVDGQRRVLRIDNDATVRQAPLDQTGNTAFYLRVDDLGRVQIGAPVRAAKDNRRVLYVLATDAAGAVVAFNDGDDDNENELRDRWIAEIRGDGEYEEIAGGQKRLRRAPFRLYSAYWEAKGQRRYLTPAGTTGWTLSNGGDGVVLTLENVSMAPQGLQMVDVVWQTDQHDERRSAALDLPGSAPRTWKISPALPAGVHLDQTGVIAMDTGVDQKTFPGTMFTLTVSNAIGSADTTFTLQIRQPVTADLALIAA